MAVVMHNRVPQWKTSGYTRNCSSRFVNVVARWSTFTSHASSCGWRRIRGITRCVASCAYRSTRLRMFLTVCQKLFVKDSTMRSRIRSDWLAAFYTPCIYGYLSKGLLSWSRAYSGFCAHASSYPFGWCRNWASKLANFCEHQPKFWRRLRSLSELQRFS